MPAEEPDPDSRFVIQPDDPIDVLKTDGRKLEYNTPSPGLITVTDPSGVVEVMTTTRFHELEERRLS